MLIEVVFNDEIGSDDLARRLHEMPSPEEITALHDFVRENIQRDGRVRNVPAELVNVAERMLWFNVIHTKEEIDSILAQKTNI